MPLGRSHSSLRQLCKQCLLVSLLASTGAIVSVQTAKAEVRLGREFAGGDFSIGVMTWWDIPFRSVVRQRYDFSCGVGCP